MLSERLQQHVAALIDTAGEALERGDYVSAATAARAVLAVDAENTDASALPYRDFVDQKEDVPKSVELR